MKPYGKITAAALLAVTLALTGCGSDNTESEDTSAATSAEKAQAALEAAVDAAMESEEEALSEENIGSNAGKDLSAYEKIYTFTLAGEEYSLSCPLQDLLNDGWSFSDEAITLEGTEVISLNESLERGTEFDTIETPDFSMFKTIDGTTYEVMMGIYSDTTEPKGLGEYRVGYLYVKEDLGLDLVLDTGITFGADEEEVREVYGEPASEAEGILSYSFIEEDVALMPNRPEFLNFYVNEGKVYMISMQYFPVISK